jgi:hypothetical protein
MEGTSGAAEHALLRGRACEAALSCEGPRQRAPGRAGARASGQRGGFVPGGQNQLPTTPTSPGGGSSRAYDRRCPSRSGWGEAFTASGRGGRSHRENSKTVLRRPLTRETSTGRPTQVGAAIRSRPLAERRGARAGPQGSRLRGGFRGASLGATRSGAKLHQRATAGVVLRSSGVRGRARRSYRLQKSTGGARPPSPMREEHVDNEGRSSPEARERHRGERAPEAGSSVAKRRERWRALHLIGNGGRESAHQGAPVDGRRLGPNQVVRFDERAMEAVLAFADSGKPDPMRA